jgi:hypothetical protein
MEILAAALEGIGSIIGGVASAAAFVLVAGIVASTFLIYTDTCTLDEIKNFLKKEDKKKW